MKSMSVYSQDLIQLLAADLCAGASKSNVFIVLEV